MAFHLGYGLAPQMERKGVRCSTEDTEKVIFPSLDGLFGQVATMVVGWDKLVVHVSGLDFDLVCH